MSGRFLLKPQILTGSLLAVGLVMVAWQVQAGPITNPGGPPFVKLGVYQGVISVVPGGAQVMEIGNNGTDILGTGDLVFGPGSGKNVYIKSGGLCFGAIGSVDCKSSWSGLGGGSTLDQVLAAGNTSNYAVVLGQGSGSVADVALVDIQQTNVAKDAINARLLSSNNKSAIYGENRGNGFAGYFTGGSGSSVNPTVSIDNLYRTGAPGAETHQIDALKVTGMVEIQQYGTNYNSWTLGDLVRIAAKYPGGSGSTLHVVNTYGPANAATFEGRVNVSGNVYDSDPSYTSIYDAPGVLGGYRTGGCKWCTGGKFVGGNGSINSAGIVAEPYQGAYANPSYGIYAFGSNNANAYAGYFEGRVAKKGFFSGGTALDVLASTTLVGGTACTTVCSNSGLTCQFVAVPAGGATTACSDTTAGRICVCR